MTVQVTGLRSLIPASSGSSFAELEKAAKAALPASRPVKMSSGRLQRASQLIAVPTMQSLACSLNGGRRTMSFESFHRAGDLSCWRARNVVLSSAGGAGVVLSITPLVLTPVSRLQQLTTETTLKPVAGWAGGRAGGRAGRAARSVGRSVCRSVGRSLWLFGWLVGQLIRETKNGIKNRLVGLLCLEIVWGGFRVGLTWV